MPPKGNVAGFPHPSGAVLVSAVTIEFVIAQPDGLAVVISEPSFRRRRFSLIPYIVLDLLTFFGEVAEAVVLPLGSVDFSLHPGRDTLAEHPDLRAFAHQGVTEEQSKLALVRLGIVQELPEQQMWCDGDISGIHSMAAMSSGSDHVLFDVSCIGRADCLRGFASLKPLIWLFQRCLLSGENTFSLVFSLQTI